jgi:hypothetical protein
MFRLWDFLIGRRSWSGRNRYELRRSGLTPKIWCLIQPQTPAANQGDIRIVIGVDVDPQANVFPDRVIDCGISQRYPGRMTVLSMANISDRFSSPRRTARRGMIV